MILSNLTIPLLGMVDTAVMGHMSQPFYMGAVALGGLIFSFVYWGFGFLRMGTTGLTAQAQGREDADEVRAILARALFLGFVFAVLLLALQSLIRDASLAVIDASLEVEAATTLYFDARIWSAPAALANYALIGWFLGRQNARVPLYLLLTINITNIALDLVFVFVLNMDVVGVAVASVIAEYLGCGLGLYFVYRQLQGDGGQWQRALVVQREKLREMLVINQNIFIRTLCLIFSFAFFTTQGAKYGDVILAANAVLMNFQTLMAYALDGFAHAAESLVGRAIGRKDRKAFKRVIRAAGIWSLLIAVVFTLIYLVAGRALVNLLTDIEAVRETAYLYLPWLIAAPLLSVWSYLYDGIFIGATQTRQMRNTMLVSTFCIFLPVWFFTQNWGNHGLWLALMAFMLARALTMTYSYWHIERCGGFVSSYSSK